MSVAAHHPHLHLPALRVPSLALAGIGLSLALTAIGTFIADNGTDYTFNDWSPLLVMVPLFALIVFGLIVRTADATNGARRSVILGAAAVLSIAIFWMGLPAVLASGAAACALRQKGESGTFSQASRIGLLLAVVAVTSAVVLAFAD